jgi:hypothetical protein
MRKWAPIFSCIVSSLSAVDVHEPGSSARGWIYQAMHPASKNTAETSDIFPRHHFNGSSEFTAGSRMQTSGVAHDLSSPGLSPWEIDEQRLEARLQELDALRPRDEDDLPWPHGSIDYDRAIGVDQTFYAQDPDKRCQSLARPRLAKSVPISKQPVALLLTGQLRSAATTAQWFEENLIRATSNKVHVFVHGWSILGKRNTFHEKSLDSESDGSLAETRLSRMPGLKALALEPQEDFDSIVTHWYDARYGVGWAEMRGGAAHDSTRRFLSQWYKVSVGHGMLRRWYKGEAREPNSTVWSEARPAALFGGQRRSIPPLAIVRMRPDHLLHVRWNLTRAAAEFMSRRPSRASGGTFLAVWGPSSKTFCTDRLCPDTFNEAPSGLSCFGQQRLDDQFAFGTPEAMDAYTAPYHPYSRDGMNLFCFCNKYPV